MSESTDKPANNPDDDNDDVDEEEEDDDAICKRTRAKYSLASFTLDELETFLQETDDDDDLHHVDEEEEYRKFLSAVLGDDVDNVAAIRDDNDEDDDDDSDNDADFEIEIEEALESDAEADETNVPETRQARRRKASETRFRQGVEMERPLLPLYPYYHNNPAVMRAPPVQPTGFVAGQIGQLYTLMYEHVQLLLQMYSICVLEPSRAEVAEQVTGLLLELHHKRDLALAWRRNTAYPASCFLPQFLNPSVSEDDDYGQGRRWSLSIDGPVRSVFDVEPLKLAGKYIVDVSNAVREHQRRSIENAYHSCIVVEKEPLFPHTVCRGDDVVSDASAVSPNDKVPKKTMAAMIVESAKKESVALVPRKIAELAQPFYPLLNPALFPHKPPAPHVANRVLFTDSEDVLLAMGMMEYNNDWKAIQQRFLPCKTDHQIFVRAKNRCSSKAPDNPIKTVRKLKTSSLSQDEKARIQEGLRTFQHDWASVWRSVVPYRDPNLLPRQWRTAIGTQKSYKATSGKKEKHRIYELERRRKVAAVNLSQSGGKEDYQLEYSGGRRNNGEDVMFTCNEAYVHEAFLADWRPSSTGLYASNFSSSSLQSSCLPVDVAASECRELLEVSDSHVNKDSHYKKDHVGEAYTVSGGPACRSTTKLPTFRSRVHPRSKPNNSNLVRLAPELPPVKLPPAVRVMSQASLRSPQLGSSTKVVDGGHGLDKYVGDPPVADCASNVERRFQEKTKVVNSNPESLSSQQCALLSDRGPTEARDHIEGRGPIEDGGSDLDAQIHPLLFRAVEEGNAPFYSLDNSTRSSTFSFFPALQHQINLNLIQNPHPGGLVPGSRFLNSKEMASTPSGLDFHPLLQRTSELNSNSIGSESTGCLLTTDLELSRDRFMEEVIYSAGTDGAQLAAASRARSRTPDAHDLDLDIHLSSESRKRKFSSLEGTQVNPVDPSASVRNFAECANEISDLRGRLSQLDCHHSVDSTEAEVLEKSGCDNSDVQLHLLHGGPGGSSACVDESPGDQTLSEIVMEQEELSDSDEEIEDVEFECEEMTDSDGEEGSVAEQTLNAKYKKQESPTVVSDGPAQKSKSVSCGVSEKSRGQRKGRTPRSDLARLGKGSTKCSWLSLNSRGFHPTLQSGTRSTKSSTRLPVSLHSNSNSQLPMLTTSNSPSAEQVADLPQLDPLPTSSRKPRKKVSKTPFNSRPDVAAANSSGKEKNGKV